MREKFFANIVFESMDAVENKISEACLHYEENTETVHPSPLSHGLLIIRELVSGLYLPLIRSEGIDTIAVIVDTSGSLPAATLAAFWAEVREVASELQPERSSTFVDAAVQDAAEYAASDLPDGIAIRGRGRDRLPAWLRLARRARHPARRLPLPHRHALFDLPGGRAWLSDLLGQLRRTARRLEPRALGRAHRPAHKERRGTAGAAISPTPSSTPTRRSPPTFP